MALTAKERMARYRQRIRDDPAAHERYKARERERNQRRKENCEFKFVKDMTKREHRAQKKIWKTYNLDRKRRQQANRNMLTPPHSPDASDFQLENNTSRRRSTDRRNARNKTACYRANKKLKVQLKFQERLTERYKRKLNRLIERVGQKKVVTNKPYILQKALVQSLKEKYLKAKSNKEKRQIASFVSGKILKKYGIVSFAQHVLHISRRHMKPELCRPPFAKSLRMKAKVQQYYERDDVSRIKPDKQATITRKGEKRQVRLLLDDLTNLHAKYLSEGNEISYSLFCRLRPFHIVKPTERDRKTCLCKIHDNLQMKLNTAFATGMCRSKNINDMIKTVVCDVDNKECMYLECNQCKESTVQWDFGGNPGSQVTWKTWKNKREIVQQYKDKGVKTVSRTVKELDQGTKQTFSDTLNAEINRARRHIFNIRAQYKSLKYLREKLSHEDIMMHIDFSENYNCKYADEVQSMHFGASKRQISLHTGVVYSDKEVISFCSVSDSLKHGPGAIWAHIQPVLDFMQNKYPNTAFKRIHFVSDGPTTQYRNKANFHMWANKVVANNFQHSTWNFLEASHGKGAADGVGAVVKRKADNLVIINQTDITCAKDLYECLTQSDLKVKMFLVKDTDIEDTEKQIPQDLSPITNTMKLHQLCLQSPQKFTSRVLSCFCQYPLSCDCFDPLPTDVCLFEQNPTQFEEQSVNDHDVPSIHTTTEEPPRSANDTQTILRKPEMLSLGLLGQYAVVKYDGVAYPGIVLDIDEDDVEVKVMHKIGINRYFWPHLEDRLWYREEDIVCVIDEPQAVTARHCQINPKIWPLIEEELCS